MKFLLILAFFSSIIFVSESKTEFVFLIWRHGDRNPNHLLPNDVNNSADTWEGGVGELTKLGIQQMYVLGEAFRILYAPLTNNSYSPETIRIISGDDNRTINSAEAVLAGMYPPSTDFQKWNPKLNWQPIPVHITDMIEKIQSDFMVRDGGTCKNLEYISKTEYIRNLSEEYSEFFNYLEEISGKNITNLIKDLSEFSDPLNVESRRNRSWPVWMNETIFETADNMFAGTRGYVFTFDDALRLSGGWILKQIFRFLADYRAKSNKRKIVGFSVHDDNLGALATALQIPLEIRRFGYGSYYAIELQDDDTIQVWFSSGVGSPRQEILLPACSNRSECKYSELLQSSQKIFPGDDWDAECGNKITSYNSTSNLHTLIIILAVLTAVFFLITVISCALYVSTKNQLNVLRREAERKPLMARYS